MRYLNVINTRRTVGQQGVQQMSTKTEARAFALWVEVAGLFPLPSPHLGKKVTSLFQGTLKSSHPVSRGGQLPCPPHPPATYNRCNCKQKSFNLDIKENTFAARTVQQCHQLHRVVVTSPCSEIFTSWLEKPWEQPGNEHWLNRRLETSQGPFQSELWYCDLVAVINKNMLHWTFPLHLRTE